MVQTTDFQSDPLVGAAGEALKGGHEPEKTGALPQPAAQRVVLHGIRWATYESLLKDLENSRAPRLAFDRGTLELMSPLQEHEEVNGAIALLVDVIAEERGVNVRRLGSTTLKRANLERGLEADSCFYIQSARLIRGKRRVDLATDPLPDLLIEIDLTNPSVPKLPIYTRLGVPEVWRYDGSAVTILTLSNGEYHEARESAALPGLDSATLSALVADSLSLERFVWLRKVRDWAQSQKG